MANRKRPVRVDKKQPSLWKRDGRKRPVPVWLKDVFQGRAYLLRWCNRLEQLIYELEEFDATAQLEAARQQRTFLSSTKHLDVMQTCRQLKGLVTDVQRKMPFCRCPRLDDEPQCPACKGDGWVNASQLNEHQISSQT